MQITAKRILVVDDEPIILATIAEVLRDFGGYNVQTATNGAEALERVLTDPPDALVVDLIMPLLDRRGLVAALRANPATGDIPVAIVSAVREADLVADELGLEARLQKPFDINHLLGVVDGRVCGRWSSRRTDNPRTAAPAQSRASILIVEDDTLIRELIGDELRSRRRATSARVLGLANTAPCGSRQAHGRNRWLALLRIDNCEPNASAGSWRGGARTQP